MNIRILPVCTYRILGLRQLDALPAKEGNTRSFSRSAAVMALFPVYSFAVATRL